MAKVSNILSLLISDATVMNPELFTLKNIDNVIRAEISNTKKVVPIIYGGFYSENANVKELKRIENSLDKIILRLDEYPKEIRKQRIDFVQKLHSCIDRALIFCQLTDVELDVLYAQQGPNFCKPPNIDAMSAEFELIKSSRQKTPVTESKPTVRETTEQNPWPSREYEFRAEISSLKRTNSYAEEKIKDLTIKSECEKALVKKLLDQIDTMKKTNETLVRELSEEGKNSSQALERIFSLNDEKNRLDALLRKQTEITQQLTMENESLRTMLKSGQFEETIKVLQAEVKHRDACIEDLKIQAKTASKNTSELCSQLQQCDVIIAELQTQAKKNADIPNPKLIYHIELLQKNLNMQKDDMEKLSSDMVSSKKLLEETLVQINPLVMARPVEAPIPSPNVQVFKDRIETLSSENVRLKNENQSQKDTIQKLYSDRIEIGTKMDQLTTEVKKSRDIIKAHTERINNPMGNNNIGGFNSPLNFNYDPFNFLFNHGNK